MLEIIWLWGKVNMNSPIQSKFFWVMKYGNELESRIKGLQTCFPFRGIDSWKTACLFTSPVFHVSNTHVYCLQYGGTVYKCGLASEKTVWILWKQSAMEKVCLTWQSNYYSMVDGAVPSPSHSAPESANARCDTTSPTYFQVEYLLFQAKYWGISFTS